MIGKRLAQSSIALFVWIYTVFAASLAEEAASSMTIEENTTDSCFKESLPKELQLQYDICLGNNINGENMMKENEIFSCILKTMGVISEDVIEISKLKMPAAEDENSPDMKMIEDEDAFNMSVEKCEKNEEVSKADDFVQCLYEALSMNCTNPMPANEETTAAEEES